MKSRQIPFLATRWLGLLAALFVIVLPVASTRAAETTIGIDSGCPRVERSCCCPAPAADAIRPSVVRDRSSDPCPCAAAPAPAVPQDDVPVSGRACMSHGGSVVPSPVAREAIDDRVPSHAGSIPGVDVVSRPPLDHLRRIPLLV